MSSSTIGLAGHGMLIAPVCPCRAVLVEDLLILGRGYRGPLITEVVVKRGTAPATAAPTSADGIHYALGPGGPEMRVESANLDEVVLRIDVGLGAAEWNVLAPGFWFDMPRSVVLFSPDPQTPGDFPELHHGLNLEAMIMFKGARRAAREIVPTAPGGKPLVTSVLDTSYGDVSVYAYEYDHGGEHWLQNHYVLPHSESTTVVMMAQAPTALWPDIKAAAELVTRSFQPTA